VIHQAEEAHAAIEGEVEDKSIAVISVVTTSSHLVVTLRWRTV
jgi:hypothetical protein